MKILMLKTRVGSNNGIDLKTFLEGEYYDVPSEMSQELADSFMAIHHAKEANEKTFTPVEETKADKPVKEVKAKKAPKKTKKDAE